MRGGRKKQMQATSHPCGRGRGATFTALIQLTPSAFRLSIRRAHWVDLPHRSTPSSTINAPRGEGEAGAAVAAAPPVDAAFAAAGMARTARRVEVRAPARNRVARVCGARVVSASVRVFFFFFFSDSRQGRWTGQHFWLFCFLSLAARRKKKTRDPVCTRSPLSVHMHTATTRASGPAPPCRPVPSSSSSQPARAVGRRSVAAAAPPRRAVMVRRDLDEPGAGGGRPGIGAPIGRCGGRNVRSWTTGWSPPPRAKEKGGVQFRSSSSPTSQPSALSTPLSSMFQAAALTDSVPPLSELTAVGPLDG
jgi:hypothetical protein